METRVKVVEEKSPTPKPSIKSSLKSSPRGTDYDLVSSQLDNKSEIKKPDTDESQYTGNNITFNRFGEFNKDLNADEMMKAFIDVMDSKIIPPKKISPSQLKIKTKFLQVGSESDKTSPQLSTNSAYRQSDLKLN